MAIGFARLQFVKRADGKNVCAKAAYNSRSRIEFEGNDFSSEKTYDWSKLSKPIFHEVLLPNGVDDKFKSVETLWKAVEEKEIRKNSQLAYDIVLALPDDDCISTEDKIFLTKDFVQKQFIDKGLAAQIDIHQPEVSNEGKNGHNWHAHILVTTRRFTQDGKELGEKVRDIVPVIRLGKVISGPNWEKSWTDHQNQYFDEKGIALKVDSKGVIPQIHLGPVRMRARAFSLIEENANQIALNERESKDPKKILELITETRSVFSSEELERFLSKHVEPSMIPDVRKNFWSQTEIEELVDKNSEIESGKYTTKKIYEEENQIIRLADRINSKESLETDKEHAIKTHTDILNAEQKRAFENILSGKRLSLIEGHAGVGKSYLLAALKNAYEANGYHVRAFGPDNATAEILKEKGFTNAENTYKFLFSHNRGQREVSSKNEVWMLDEAGKIGNRPLAEMMRLAEKYKVQLILSGCSAQMASVERGAMFKVLSERYGAQHLEDIQRQKSAHQRDIARKLAKGSMSAALDGIVQADGLKWASNKNEAIEELVKKWAYDRIATPVGSDLIIAHTNNEVRVLNEVVRLSLKEKGEISDKEYQCDTSHGKIYVSVGDKLEFRKNDSELGVTNHMRGVLVRASEDKFVVAVPSNGKTREVSFNPSKYSHFQLGYATTFYSAQGSTVDRAYVLLSPYMNKEMFYVGLTRHVKHVNLFVSKTDYKSLSDLKRQAFKSNLKETTLSFITKQQIEKDKLDQIKMEKIEELKISESLFSKAKGYGLSAVVGVQSAVEGIVEKYQDRLPNKKFYNPNFSDDQRDAKRVFEVKSDEIIDLNNIRENSAEQKITINSINKTSENENKKDLSSLTENSKQLLKDYQKSWQHASSLKTGSSNPTEKSASYRDWQEACAKRNELAFNVVKSVPKDDLKHIFGNESFEILFERSLRHESIAKRNQISHSSIEDDLKSNIESLAYALFPDGPTRKDRTGFRFGTKGSLAVACRGEDKGCYHDFENGQGGGPLSLIQKALGINYSEAKEWAKNFLGHSNDMPSMTRFTSTKTTHEKNDEWINLKPPSNIHAPSLKDISTKLDSEYTEAARYAYTNEKGELLFYTLRLVEKVKPSSKIFLPLSYGHWNEDSQNPKWWVKGYQANEGKPLYNLCELANNKTATVLIRVLGRFVSKCNTRII